MCKNKEQEKIPEENNKNVKPLKMSLEQNISTSVSKAEEARLIVRVIDHKLQIVIDQGNATRPFIPYMNHSEKENINDIWSEVPGNIEILKTQLMETSPTTDAISGSATISSAYVYGYIADKSQCFEYDEKYNKIKSNFFEVTMNSTLKDDVLLLLKNLHLDCPRKGKKSALELFKVAHEAYERPVIENNPDITSLIPIRESIITAIQELIRLCPKQEHIGSSYVLKISFIANQLKKDLISDMIVQKWAEEWNDINDKDLSASKDEKISREEWGHKLHRATQFFYSFLSGLDPTKIRKMK